MENNILLAEFLGFDILTNGRFQYESEIIISLPYFENDWNYLMKVVEKIECITFSDSRNSMRFDVKIKHHSCRINDWKIEGKNFIHIGGCNSKIEAVYNACIEFVKWYNEQNIKS